MPGQGRDVVAGDHSCCGATRVGHDGPQGQQWDPGQGLGAGKATGALQTLTALCLVGLLAVSEMGTPEQETAPDSLALIGVNGPILHVSYLVPFLTTS